MTSPQPVRRARRPWLVPLLLVFFLTVPIIEVWLLVSVGQWIGALPTIGILVAEAILGAWLMRREGAKAWTALNTAMQSGKLPTGEILDAVLILLGGVLGDRLGRRRVFLLGVVWFAVASALCAASPSAGFLIGARALQGVGAALLTRWMFSCGGTSVHTEPAACRSLPVRTSALLPSCSTRWNRSSSSSPSASPSSAVSPLAAFSFLFFSIFSR